MIDEHRAPAADASTPGAVHAAVRAGLEGAYAHVRTAGAPALELEGGLLRPMLSLAGALHVGETSDAFWSAALAVQLAHEASLLHDDVVDSASVRRGHATMAAEHGVARALIEGDHVLTLAYRAAAATGSGAFVAHFAFAVERTVAAEKQQGATLGRRIDAEHHARIATGKAGELMACALAAAALLRGAEGTEATATTLVRLGRELGLAYQMLDDLLDYCSGTPHGKPTLGDYRQGRWTWPLDVIPEARLGMADDEIVTHLHRPVAAWHGETPLARMQQLMDSRLLELSQRCAEAMPGDALVAAMIGKWRAHLAGSCDEERSARRRAVRVALSQRVATDAGEHTDEGAQLTRHARSFHFASRLLPREDRARIARVYAFCRVMDDLVDEPAAGHVSGDELLDEWMTLARGAYEGHPSGVATIDAPMAEMAAGAVPFDYVEELAAGMRMDLASVEYDTLATVRTYARRVAGVVGLWIARLAGVCEPAALEHAARMGEAMQLSNIVRDVGEDWRRGRMYLPAQLLARHGLGRADVGAIVDGARDVDDAYRAVLEEMMHAAEAEYEAAFRWIVALPPSLQPTFAVAARLYAGIHDALRRHDHDNVRLRAHTTLARKLVLTLRALLDLHMLRRARAGDASPHLAGPAPAGAPHA